MSGLVLVVGAGPVGLTTAMVLKRRGVELRIIDKAAERTDKSKALVIWPRTLELLDIEGCAQPFLDAGTHAVGARILADGNLLVHVPFDAARSIYRFALMIPQSATEQLLEEQLAKHGARVERGVELTSFAGDGQGVTAVLRHGDGSDERVRADYVAACDGAHSTLRHGLDLPFEGDTLPSDWVLADVELDGMLPRDELTICWTSEGILAFFPIRGDRFRIIADVEFAPAAVPPAPTLPELQALLDTRGPPGLRARDPVWMSNFRINERKLKEYARGRVFLAGDAAHVHSPAGGQGMNTGMQDGFNLGWKLAMVWHRQASPALLATYSPERSAIGDQVLRNAGNMTKAALLHNPILREIRNLAVGALGHIPALRQRMVDQLTEVDLRYAHGALTQSVHGSADRPAGGERAPDIGLNAGDGGPARLYELLSAGKFVVLSVSAAPVDVPDSLKPIAVAAAASANPHYESGHVYLVRPDAYIAFSTDEDDFAQILVALERIQRAPSADGP